MQCVSCFCVIFIDCIKYVCVNFKDSFEVCQWLEASQKVLGFCQCVLTYSWMLICLVLFCLRLVWLGKEQDPYWHYVLLGGILSDIVPPFIYACIQFSCIGC